MTSIVILISGRGSNMEAIVKAAQNEAWPAKIAAVISNRPEAGGLDFAKSHGIETAVLDHRSFKDRASFDAKLVELIDSYKPDLVVLAGFMRILTGDFVRHYEGRLLNIHPSLLPLFPGLHTHEQALEAGVSEHGATVHFVTEALDHGPMVIQASVPVLPGDTPDTLAQRVLKQEHVIYPRAVRWFIDNRLSISENRVLVSPPEAQLLTSTDK
ncbi:MAG: phosphoribosylglycinamide formyltransferase [Polynucleobacter victoriensis]|jgi:phosphoribosylglycinamide formyltransferase-1|uniref:Phosphoribosylglycinamide formyltransferase n=1 Tax=Polynucleobacter victoriensis TaxID=2049319 RepID=A0A212TGZ1_9BURK|nr:phosphoribosylglycinamide formyltransferase [Polynucleobacter victoriensis]SNC65101.1 phosphoribosylglycinamide formyltransferase-1 [Polynucleobacter victoriensis]